MYMHECMDVRWVYMDVCGNMHVHTRIHARTHARKCRLGCGIVAAHTHDRSHIHMRAHLQARMWHSHAVVAFALCLPQV